MPLLPPDNPPVLDPKELAYFRPHEFSLNRINEAKPAAVPEHPDTWRNPFRKYLAHRNQDQGGTCTGQAWTYGKYLQYMKLTGDIPTQAELDQYRENTIDLSGARVDILPPNEFSSECAYQMGRWFGNITYPSGGEIRFNAAADRDYGTVLESMWHSDKARTKVWNHDWFMAGNGKSYGGASPLEAAAFAAKHRIKGWAMVGDDYGNATYDEVCSAIYIYGFVICGIPIYENYVEMKDGDGTYPGPKGPIVGYHAQCMDGYTPDEIELEHSWKGFCGQHGKLSREYFNIAKDQSVFLVVIDEEETIVGHDIYKSLTVNAKAKDTGNTLTADLFVDTVPIGKSPQTFAAEPGKVYELEARCTGYKPGKMSADGSVDIIMFALEPEVPEPPTPEVKKNWLLILLEKFIDWLTGWLKR